MIAIALFLSIAIDFGANRQVPLENNQANELYKAGKTQEALDLYLKAFEKDPQNGALAYNIGNAYAALGQQDKAAEFLDKATKARNENARDRAHFNLGNLNLAQEKYQEAANHYIDYLQHQPDDIEAKRNLELALRKLQQNPQDQQKQDKNKDQKDQKDQQDQDGNSDKNSDQKDQQSGDSKDQNDGKDSKQDQNQQGKDQKDQQNKDQNKDQNGNQKDQQGKDQNKDQKQDQESQQDQRKDQKQDGKQAQQGDQSQLDPNVKRQILDALDQQEQAQQKEFQQRKTGKVIRRAKDW